MPVILALWVLYHTLTNVGQHWRVVATWTIFCSVVVVVCSGIWLACGIDSCADGCGKRRRLILRSTPSWLRLFLRVLHFLLGCTGRGPCNSQVLRPLETILVFPELSDKLQVHLKPAIGGLRLPVFPHHLPLAARFRHVRVRIRDSMFKNIQHPTTLQSVRHIGSNSCRCLRQADYQAAANSAQMTAGVDAHATAWAGVLALL